MKIKILKAWAAGDWGTEILEVPDACKRPTSFLTKRNVPAWVSDKIVFNKSVVYWFVIDIDPELP